MLNLLRRQIQSIPCARERATLHKIVKATFATAPKADAKGAAAGKKDVNPNDPNIFTKHMADFKEAMAKLEKDNVLPLKKPFPKVYSPSWNMKHHRINMSPVKTAEFFHDFVGPEQVSAHYENFMVARKFALIFWAGIFALGVGVTTVDLHWIAKSSALPFLFWMQMMYIYMEGRKSFFKPLLVRFYRRVAANEVYNFEVFYHENIENKIRDLLRNAKSQLDYFYLHKDYDAVRVSSIRNFLMNEQLNLQKNIQERTVNILKQAETYENLNSQAYIRNILELATAEIDKQLKEGTNSAEVQKAMLDSAIQGLRAGKMEYVNDPILPMVLNVVQREVAKLKSLSAEEQSKLVALTAYQIEQIRSNDKKAKEDFLKTLPRGLDTGLRANESVKKTLGNWGK